MTAQAQYAPGPAAGAEITKRDGDKWELVLTRHLRHSPQRVWDALTDPAQLHQWAPFETDGNMGSAGATVKLTTVGAPGPHVVETKILRAEAPKVLEYNWGGGNLRWELEPAGGGTRMTLWAHIDRRYVAMGAAGWHICFDVLQHLLDGAPLGRMVGPELMKHEGWQRLHREYAAQFGVELPKW
jgi:uncharacterized protein YndB with AHSA1/START domain